MYRLHRHAFNANLLKIPRELRNQIYNHLTQNINSLLWDVRSTSQGWAHVPKTSLTVQIDILEGPLLSVMLTHPRLYQEYRESNAYNQLSITMRRRPAWHSMHLQHIRDYLGAGTLLNKRTADLMSRAVHVTILFECEPENPRGDDVYPNSTVPEEFRALLSTFITNPANLITVKVALTAQTKTILPTTNAPYRGFHLDPYLPKPLTALANLPLLQCAEAWRLSHRVDFRVFEGQILVAKVGCYTYGNKMGLKEDWYWTEGQVLKACPDTGVEELSGNECARWESREEDLYQLKGWREKRGKDQRILA